jgi:hypothetical protein
MKIKANVPKGTCIILFSGDKVFRFRHNTTLDVPDEYVDNSFKVFIEHNKLTVIKNEPVLESEPLTENDEFEVSENIEELPKKKRGRKKKLE